MHARAFVRSALLPLAAVSLFAANVTLAQSTPRDAGTATVTRSDAATVYYRTARIDGVEIFYREAGPADAPTLVLLHGFPSSSHMFRNLIPALSARYHIIAPDYPGFGLSEAPDRARFQYSFAKLTEVVDALLTRLEVKRYALYVMDYGAPVGYRLALRHPERVTALIVQNGNAYAEGLREFWTPIKAYWASGSPAHREALRGGDALTIRGWRQRSDANRSHRVALRPDPAESSWQRGHSTRPLLRLPYQRRPLSAVSGVLSPAQTADPDRMGPQRSDLSRRGRTSVSARSSRCRTPPSRYGAFRP